MLFVHFIMSEADAYRVSFLMFLFFRPKYLCYFPTHSIIKKITNRFLSRAHKAVSADSY